MSGFIVLFHQRTLGATTVVKCWWLRGFSYLCFSLHGWGWFRRSTLFVRWRHEAWVVGRDAREPDRGLLGQRRAAVPMAVMMVEEVVWGRGGRGGRRMRVRAAGSSGVTTVNAVQTTVKGGEKWGDDQRREIDSDSQYEGNQMRAKIRTEEEWITWKERIGGVWGRKGGKQLTQHTKMQQALTEVNPIKTT